jgi:hypothetical protein
MARAVSWGLPLLTLAVYLWLVIGYGLPLQDLAGGLLPFDLRPLGYDALDARAYLMALPPQGVALYLGPVARLDTAFPILMGLTLLWWMRPLTDLSGMVAALSALAYVALDLAENGATAALMQAGPFGMDARMVTAASALTQAKFLALGLAAILAARQSWRRAAQGRQAGGTSQA